MGIKFNQLPSVIRALLITVGIIVATLSIHLLVMVTPVAILFYVVYLVIEHWDDDFINDDDAGD